MMAREVVKTTEIDGHGFAKGTMVLLPFGAANRDPEIFDSPEQVVLDRPQNPHLTFGAGIHRCPGSHLARMMIRTALTEWIAAFPEFGVDESRRIEWIGGTVRRPRRLYLNLPPSDVSPQSPLPRPSRIEREEPVNAVRPSFLIQPVRFGGRKVNLFVRDWRPTTAQRGTLLFLHGFADNGSDFDFLARQAVRQGFRVLCPDLPGRGRTAWLPAELYTLNNFGRCIPALVGEVEGPVGVLASSWSTFVAARHFAQSKSQSRLVLLDPVLEGGDAQGAIVESLVDDSNRTFTDMAGLKAYIRRTRDSAPLLDEEQLDVYVRNRAIWVDGRLRLAYDPEIARMLAATLERRTGILNLMGRIAAPLMLIYGLGSKFREPSSIEAMRKIQPQAVIRTDYPGGHPPSLTDTAQTQPILDFFGA
jgi:pimeloyl-ACP methyl ester carboxylesterase